MRSCLGSALEASLASKVLNHLNNGDDKTMIIMNNVDTQGEATAIGILPYLAMAGYISNLGMANNATRQS